MSSDLTPAIDSQEVLKWRSSIKYCEDLLKNPPYVKGATAKQQANFLRIVEGRLSSHKKVYYDMLRVNFGLEEKDWQYIYSAQEEAAATQSANWRREQYPEG